MTRAPFSAPTRYATPRRAVGQASANPAGAGKWMRSPRRRGGACAPRHCVCLRGFSQGLSGNDRIKFRAEIALAVDLHNAIVAVFGGDNVVANANLDSASVVCAAQNNFGIGVFGQLVSFHNGRGGRQLRDQFVDKRCHAVGVGWRLNRFVPVKIEGFGKGDVMLLAQVASSVVVGEATKNFGAVDSAHDIKVRAVLVDDRNLAAGGLGGVCFHYADNISCRLESVNRYFKKKSDFFGGWESGTYGGFYRGGGVA